MTGAGRPERRAADPGRGGGMAVTIATGNAPRGASSARPAFRQRDPTEQMRVDGVGEHRGRPGELLGSSPPTTGRSLPDRRSAVRRLPAAPQRSRAARVDGEAEPADFDRLDIPKLSVAESHMPPFGRRPRMTWSPLTDRPRRVERPRREAGDGSDTVRAQSAALRRRSCATGVPEALLGVSIICRYVSTVSLLVPSAPP